CPLCPRRKERGCAQLRATLPLTTGGPGSNREWFLKHVAILQDGAKLRRSPLHYQMEHVARHRKAGAGNIPGWHGGAETVGEISRRSRDWTRTEPSLCRVLTMDLLEPPARAGKSAAARKKPQAERLRHRRRSIPDRRMKFATHRDFATDALLQREDRPLIERDNRKILCPACLRRRLESVQQGEL